VYYPYLSIDATNKCIIVKGIDTIVANMVSAKKDGCPFIIKDFGLLIKITIPTSHITDK
jgi:hypothetical protein